MTDAERLALTLAPVVEAFQRLGMSAREVTGAFEQLARTMDGLGALADDWPPERQRKPRPDPAPRPERAVHLRR